METQGQEKKAFKDWWDLEAAEALGNQISGAMPGFDRKRFVRLATKGLADLEMSDRVKQFSVALRKTLPDSVPEAMCVLVGSLPAEMEDCESLTDGWLQWPVGQFILEYGVDYFEESMVAMIALTKRFSAEFAVRPFADRYPEITMHRLLDLTSDVNPHVRRWCSEGIRPRLPWGSKLRGLVEDPGPIWPILEALKDDEELYVRRSVANNLNDIAKDHPAAVVECCRKWMAEPTAEREWLVKRALRTLIKDGDASALEVVGYGRARGVELEFEIAPKAISVGESIEMEVSVGSSHRRSQNLMIDYVVHYVRKNGKTSEKVFKWKSLSILEGDSVTLTKRHSMRMTTIRALYVGRHRVEIQVNGERLAEAHFDLL